MAPGSLVIHASTPILAGSNYLSDQKVLIDLAILYISAFYDNDRAYNNFPVIGPRYRVCIETFKLI